MRKMLVFLAIFCLLSAPVTPALPQTADTPLVLDSMPTLSWQKIDGGSMLVVQAGDKTYYILNGQQTAFPPDTQSGRKQRSDGKWEVYFLLPGADPQTGWKVVNTNMVGNNSTPGPGVRQAKQDLPPGVIPEGMSQKASPHTILTGFPTGYATVTAAIEQQMAHLVKVCKDNDVLCILEGQASRLSYSACYVDMDEGYIAPPSGHNPSEHPNAQLVKGDRNCNEELAQIRAMNAAKKLVEMGVPKERVFWLTHASWGIRPGTNYENQAVVAFVISRSSVNIETNGPVISNNAPPAAECPTCNQAEPPIINIHGDCFVASRQNDNGRWTVTVICFLNSTTPPAPASTKNDEGDDCWKWALAGGLGGGGLGWGVSQIQVEGGQGAGSAGNGGDVSICGDNPTGCIVGGALLGAGTSYLSCKISKHHKEYKEHKK